MAKLLLFGYGNPGRGDDGLGTALIEHIEKLNYADVVCQNDMQLQVEHVTDLSGCERVVFIDADMSCSEPFEYAEIFAEKDGSYSSHAMNPSALLHAYSQVYGKNPPPAFVLRIRGYEFELGDAMSTKATHNLDAAIKLVYKLCESVNLQH